ncbi:MAG TPA: hypothetical protein VL330_23380, partial [Actinomycetes bacterium]|nr:hypothetical protein [Actinomycetes bacterium]
IEARKNRAKYDKAMSEFAELVGSASDEVKDKFEVVRDTQDAYWHQLLRHKEAIHDRDAARIEARERAALVGQKAMPLS